jgi:hypothetical protein
MTNTMTFQAIRAEALFVSHLQTSQSPRAEQVRQAVDNALRRWGVRGCAARMAVEFGDHPDTAATRMTWALATINSTYSAGRQRLAAGPTGTVRPHGTTDLPGAA